MNKLDNAIKSPIPVFFRRIKKIQVNPDDIYQFLSSAERFLISFLYSRPFLGSLNHARALFLYNIAFYIIHYGHFFRVCLHFWLTKFFKPRWKLGFRWKYIYTKIPHHIAVGKVFSRIMCSGFHNRFYSNTKRENAFKIELLYRYLNIHSSEHKMETYGIVETVSSFYVKGVSNCAIFLRINKWNK